eukprot:gene31864-41347_t
MKFSIALLVLLPTIVHFQYVTALNSPTLNPSSSTIPRPSFDLSNL